MPESAIPVVAFVVAAFSLFMVVVGAVSIWSNLPDRKKPD